MNTPLQKIVLASHNPGKLREFAALLATLDIELVSQRDLGVPPAGEPHATFLENVMPAGPQDCLRWRTIRACA